MTKYYCHACLGNNKFGASEKHFKGNLIAGDTPAANLAGGFKLSVGGAYSCC